MTLDDHLRTSVEHLVNGLREPLESTLRAYADELRRRAAADLEAAVRQATDRATSTARQQAEHEITEVRAEAAARVEALTRHSQQQLDALRAAADAEIANVRAAADVAIAAARNDVQAEIEVVRARAADDIGAARVAAEADIAHAQQAAARERSDIERSYESRLLEASRTLEQSRASLNATLNELADMRREAMDARRHLEAIRAEAEGVQQRHASDARHIAALQSQLHGIHALDRCGSLGEVLSTLVDAATHHADRVLLMTLQGERLREWKAAGFADRGRTRVDVTLADAGFAREAVRTARAAVWRGDDKDARPLFAAEPEYRRAAAFPIPVGGVVVALLYVDTARADLPDEPTPPAELEMLVRHAGRVLEALTVHRTLGGGWSVSRPDATVAAPLQEGSR